MSIKRKYLQEKNVIYPVPRHDKSILRCAHAIENAIEGHYIDSCFLWLAEQLQPTGKLFWHRYARQFIPEINTYELKHDWEILK